MRRHAGGLKPPTPFFASPGTWARAPGGPLAPGRGCPLALPRSAGPKEKEGRREGKREGEGRGEKERGGRRKPVRAVPTAPGEPAQIARGAPRGAERRVLEEGRPKPQSGSANSSRRPGPSLEGNGSPFLSLTRPPTARSNHGRGIHSASKPRPQRVKARGAARLSPARAASPSPSKSSGLRPRREASLRLSEAPPSSPSAIFQLTLPALDLR